MSDIRNDIREIDAGAKDVALFQRLRKHLLAGTGSTNDLYDAVSIYLELAPIVDWQVPLKYVRYPKNPLIAATAIAAAALRNCPDPAFWNAVESVAGGEVWDSTDDARIQAILALNRNPLLGNEETKKILCEAVKDASATVRDSAAIAAQRCFGTPENEVLAGGELGTLFERLPKRVIDWLACS